MADDFQRLRDQSLLDLLKSSGYVDKHDKITEELLHAFFDSHPELIRSWIAIASGGRYGYYVVPPTKPSIDWVVGYNPGGKVERFADGATACARFVKFKAEDLRYTTEG